MVAAAVHLGRIAGRPQLAAGSWGLQAEILGARMGWSGGQRGGAWGAGLAEGDVEELANRRGGSHGRRSAGATGGAG